MEKTLLKTYSLCFSWKVKNTDILELPKLREKSWKVRLEFAVSLEVKNLSLFSQSKKKQKDKKTIKKIKGENSFVRSLSSCP